MDVGRSLVPVEALGANSQDEVWGYIQEIRREVSRHYSPKSNV